MSKFLTAVCALMLLVGCQQKSYDKPASAEVLNSLNERDYDAVIARVDPATADSQSTYYLASAYAGRGQIDVVSLYPLLEMYLFNRPATEWDELGDVQDPYRRFIQRIGSQEGANQRQDRAEALADYDPLLRRRYKMDEEKPDCEGASPRSKELAHSFFAEALEQLAVDHAAGRAVGAVPGMDTHYDHRASQESQRLDRHCVEVTWARIDLARDYYAARRRFLGQNAYTEDEQSVSAADGEASSQNANAENLVMEVLWRTYEAIPFLQRVPVIPTAGQDDITQAIDLMMGIRHQPAYRQQALKSVLAWSAVSLLSIYRTGFDLDRSSSMREMYCGFDIRRVLEFYPMARQRLVILQTLYRESTDEDGEVSNQIRNYMRQVEAALEKSPETLSDDERAHMTERFRESQLDKCVLNG